MTEANASWLEQDVRLAIQLADAADALTLERFCASDLAVDAKPDMTPVSDADLSCERSLRSLLSQHRPDDAILGEEFGGDLQFRGRQWIIDPIDGTKNFVRGVPVWATLIALMVDGIPVLGVISAPALARRWWAAQGLGAYAAFQHKTRRLQVSGVRNLADASLSFSSLEGWAARGLKDQFYALSDATWRLRGFGDFWSYCLLAEGAVDIACEPEVSVWDLAAVAVLVTEAGGTFTSIEGTTGPSGGSAIATNGALHQATLSILQR